MTETGHLTVAELSAIWNKSADEHNRWDTLGIDEIVEFAQAHYNMRKTKRINTMTCKQREAAFRSDLGELLKRHDAEIEVTDDGAAWGMHCGICRVSMSGRWDKDGETVAEYTEFSL